MKTRTVGKAKATASSAAGRQLGRVLRTSQPKGIGLRLEDTATRARTTARPETILEETIDYGSQANVPTGGASAFLTEARQSALSGARARTQAQASRGKHADTVAKEDLESHGPVDLNKRPAMPTFPFGESRGSLAPAIDEVLEEAEDAFTLDHFNDSRENTSAQEARRQAAQYDPAAAIRKLNAPVFTPPKSQPRVSRSPLTLRALTDEDVDILWDSIRTEEDRAEAFFGQYLKTALALHTQMQHLMQLESAGRAMLRAIDVEGQFVGLAVANPIMEKERVAHLHLYIVPEARNSMAQLLPLLVEAGERLIPARLRLAIVPSRPGWQELLEPLGFVANTVLIKER